MYEKQKQKQKQLVLSIYKQNNPLTSDLFDTDNFNDGMGGSEIGFTVMRRLHGSNLRDNSSSLHPPNFWR